MDEMGIWLEDLLGEISRNENQEICHGLLKRCGGRCAERNALPGMGGLKEELAGVERIEEIARIISRHTGAECVPEEDGFLLTYNRGKGCDCSIVRAGYVHSPVFCNCTLGFHQKVWSTILNGRSGLSWWKRFCGEETAAPRRFLLNESRFFGELKVTHIKPPHPGSAWRLPFLRRFHPPQV